MPQSGLRASSGVAAIGGAEIMVNGSLIPRA